ncbi:uncharacterized protein LOC115876316 [Sitophilus oryzae]|uniref:Uncharacterized protein LOC115876316 n=1 Tax=Sitophilus oryzae TaxID=7048 RepID=A0A6J2X9L4_SITOR|nr:uncharacterized protein LOC115876316 [Sitophilus oryzae]
MKKNHQGSSWFVEGERVSMSVAPSLVHHHFLSALCDDNAPTPPSDADDVSSLDADVAPHYPPLDDKEQQPTVPLPDCKVRRNYTCPVCDFFTQNPRRYLYHLRDDHGHKLKIYECPHCLYASKHYQKLLRHSRMVHGDSNSDQKPFPVDSVFVKLEINDPDDVIEEEPSSSFKCSLCSFTTRSKPAFNRHEREEHLKTKFFRCSKCTYVTHIKARYTKHVKYHSMPMIKCDMCDFRTPYKWNLDRHCKNHNGQGAFKCSACNFTADIKQSLTVHETNHHLPPVGQAAGLGVGRRRNKVGASDTTAAEEGASGEQQEAVPQVTAVATQPAEHSTTTTTTPSKDHVDEVPAKPKAKVKITPRKPKATVTVPEYTRKKESDFIHPDDFIHHSNGKVYIKNKCKLCNFKSPWDSEMAKHERKFHSIERDLIGVKKNQRPIPNLIPIPAQLKHQRVHHIRSVEIPEPREPTMSEKDISDICRRSANSALKDFASLFSSEDVFRTSASTSKVPDLIPAFPLQIKAQRNFKNKTSMSFFDKFNEELGSRSNLICSLCGHESKCLTEQVKHQKLCGKEANRVPNIIPVHNISASRCQYCRHRCKSSADLHNHLQTCSEALKVFGDDAFSEHENELKIDEDRQSIEDELDIKPHPMENKVFVWNDIMVPMDIEVDDSNYEYTDDKNDDVASMDLSVYSQSPALSDNSDNRQENNNNLNTNNNHTIHNSPVTTTEKIPTHGNDISVAQHKRVFKCPHCTFWASTASRFHVHIVGHLNKKPFECSLCSYRSNWRWDITKHIKLKSVRDQAHETAKVLMTDETGRRNYSKYNKYLTEIPLSSLQSSSETSGGSGTRPRNYDRNSSPSTSKSEKSKMPASGDLGSLLKVGNLKPPPGLKAVDKHFLEKRSASSEGKRTLFKCKKCNFRDASREILLQHVKGHYPAHFDPQDPLYQQAMVVAAAQMAAAAAAASSPSLLCPPGSPSPSSNLSNLSSSASSPSGTSAAPRDLSLRGTSPDRDDEASVNNNKATAAAQKGCAATAAGGVVGAHAAAPPFRCGHCNQVSNWKHVIQVYLFALFLLLVRLRDASREILLQHVKGHYPAHFDPQDPLYQQAMVVAAAQMAAAAAAASSPSLLCPPGSPSPSSNLSNLSSSASSPSGTSAAPRDLSLRGTSPDRDDEASVNNNKATAAAQKGCAATAAGGVVGAHAAAPPFRCGHCNQVSNWKHVIQRHCRLKHNGDIRVVSTKNGQEKIEIEEQPDEPDCSDVQQVGLFKCNMCPYATDSQEDYQLHLPGHIVDSNKPLKCYFCKYWVTEEYDLVGHLKLHGVCDPYDFVKSMNSNDGDGKRFRCVYCPYVTNTKTQFNYHKQFHKDRGGQYSCSRCSYNVSKRHLLHQHLKVHGMSPNKSEEMDEDITDEIPLNKVKINYLESVDIPLVWVLKDGKFSKMYNCRFCPHVNSRKVNIQEHEKMHSPREQGTNPSRPNDMEHRCVECNYICKNAGVLSSHLKVHQGLYGTIHSLVDLNKSDEEQLKELCKELTSSSDDIDTSEFLQVEMEETESVLYFCKDCPARFLKETEHMIHGDFHTSHLEFACDSCSYTAENASYLMSHSKVHSAEYQERTAMLKKLYIISNDHPEPELKQVKKEDGQSVWVVHRKSEIEKKNNILASFLSKPLKTSQNIPLSGTELFQQRSEARQKQALEEIKQEIIEEDMEEVVSSSKTPEAREFDVSVQGNPEFVYQKYIKNGRMKEKRYKCHKCPSAFEKREQYKIHLGLHGSKQRYNCEYCDYSVKYYANYVQHLKKHKFDEDAHAAMKKTDEANERNNDVIESMEVAFNATEVCDDGVVLKTSVADQQMLNITQQRKSNSTSPLDDKKTYFCPYCPYVNSRRDALDNHLKRHKCVSGVRSVYACEHCDYSVPQAHFLREHAKIHFVPNRTGQVDGYVKCDNVKLTSSNLTASSDNCEEEYVIFDEKNECSSEEKFNNNKGETELPIVQTGDLIKVKEEC